MSKHSWQFPTIVLAAGLGLTASFAHADEPNPTIGIRVDDRNGRCAASLAARPVNRQPTSMRHAGVTLRWTIDDTTTVSRTLTVVIATSAMAPAGLARDAMGVAPYAWRRIAGNNRVRIQRSGRGLRQAHRLAESDVLASALAHEIGHLLLASQRAHCPRHHARQLAPGILSAEGARHRGIPAGSGATAEGPGAEPITGIGSGHAAHPHRPSAGSDSSARRSPLSWSRPRLPNNPPPATTW